MPFKGDLFQLITSQPWESRFNNLCSLWKTATYPTSFLVHLKTRLFSACGTLLVNKSTMQPTSASWQAKHYTLSSTMSLTEEKALRISSPGYSIFRCFLFPLLHQITSSTKQYSFESNKYSYIQFNLHQARAPMSRCIIVGTHVDKMPFFRKTETLQKFKGDILKMFKRPGFPNIAACIFVSGTTGENVSELRNIIHQEAIKLNQENEMGKIVSTSFPSHICIYHDNYFLFLATLLFHPF